MRRQLLCLVGWLAFLGGNAPVPAADSPVLPTVPFYVQFIRGNNNEKPDSAEWKPVGAKLSGTLSPVFRWEHYWEVSRNHVLVTRGRVTTVPLSTESELRIRLLSDAQAELCLFKKGELRRKIVRRAGDDMSIMGGDHGDKDGWFVVVRRDKPTLD